MFFNARKNEYDAGDGPVRYLDGNSLLRPLDMPKPQLVIMAGFVIAAAIIGSVLLFSILDTVTNSAARSQATLEQNLARPASMASLPSLPTLFNLDDASILATFAEAGYTIYDNTASSGMLDVIKLPDDVTLVDAGVLYSKGIPSLTAAEASRLFNGSWTFTANRGDFTDMRVKYADFSSGSVEAAVQTAMVSEGFDVSTLGEAGVDEAGNTFQAGTIAVGDAVLNWKVSAIALSNVYDVAGLPESATYVGIRLYP